MFRFIKQNIYGLLMVLLLITFGVLLLVNPDLFSMWIVRIIGCLLIVLSGVEFYRYFKAKPEEASNSTDFFLAAVFLAVGIFCICAANWLLRAFPIFAVIFGILQILVGFYKLQKTVDDLRMKRPFWYLKAIGAAISLAFGFIIAVYSEMTFMGVWIFTAIALIFEGIFDAFAMIYSWNKGDRAPSAAHVTIPPAAGSATAIPAAGVAATAEQTAPAAAAPAPEPAYVPDTPVMPVKPGSEPPAQES